MADPEIPEGPLDGHVYRLRSDGSVWSFEGLWSHPKHQPYHVNWSGEFAIVQVYGNFKNELRLIKLEDWAELFELAWEPMRDCKFCGFPRMKPCLTRQFCASRTDAPLEPPPSDEPEDASIFETMQPNGVG